MEKIAEALQQLLAEGIIHKDLKPENDFFVGERIGTKLIHRLLVVRDVECGIIGVRDEATFSLQVPQGYEFDRRFASPDATDDCIL